MQYLSGFFYLPLCELLTHTINGTTNQSIVQLSEVHDYLPGRRVWFFDL